MLTLAIILQFQQWIMTESGVQIGILECTGIMGQNLVHPYNTAIYIPTHVLPRK